MSHFTSVSVNITDADCVEEALKQMGLKYTRAGQKFQVSPVGENQYSTYHGITIDVDAKGKTSVGADWYYQTAEFKQAAFTQRLTQAYGVAKVRKETAARGYRFMGTTTNADGSIQLTVRKFS